MFAPLFAWFLAVFLLHQPTSPYGMPEWWPWGVL